MPESSLSTYNHLNMSKTNGQHFFSSEPNPIPNLELVPNELLRDFERTEN
jgi:hypothetical protein